jgi:hypothetical protein
MIQTLKTVSKYSEIVVLEHPVGRQNTVLHGYVFLVIYRPHSEDGINLEFSLRVCRLKTINNTAVIRHNIKWRLIVR